MTCHTGERQSKRRVYSNIADIDCFSTLFLSTHRINRVILVGFLGATPELKFTVQSKPVCSFNLANDGRTPKASLRSPCNGSASFRSDGWQRSVPNSWPKGGTPSSRGGSSA